MASPTAGPTTTADPDLGFAASATILLAFVGTLLALVVAAFVARYFFEPRDAPPQQVTLRTVANRI